MALMLTSRLQCNRALNQMYQTTRIISMKVESAEKLTKETPFERNERLGRALSPHITIFKPQVTSMLSITHRITGCALTGYAMAIGIGALVMPYDFATLCTMIEGLKLSAPSLFAIKFMLSFPMAFHTLNGVRHLLWDTGKYLKIKQVYSTGYAVMAATTISSIALSCL